MIPFGWNLLVFFSCDHTQLRRDTLWHIVLHRVEPQNVSARRWLQYTIFLDYHIPCLFLFTSKRKWHIWKLVTHLGVSLTAKVRIIEGTQCERASQGPIFRGFCHICKGPSWLHLLYIKLPAMLGKKICPSDLLQSADMLECQQRGKIVEECVVSIFQRHFRLYLSRIEERVLVIRCLKHQHTK